MLSAFIVTVQDIHVTRSSSSPCCLSYKFKRLKISSENPPDREVIPLISGLDRVAFGTVSAAEAVKICNVKPPQYLCYMVSGSTCDVIQLIIDCIIHKGFSINDPSVCWAIGFALSISFRHTTHRYLVFGNYIGGYWNSLLRMYGGYSIIIVLSTAFNVFMTKYAKIEHYIAWVVTLLWTGVVNYFILKKLWQFGGKAEQKDCMGEVFTQSKTNDEMDALESNSKMRI